MVETTVRVIQRKIQTDFRTPLTDFRSPKSFLNIKDYFLFLRHLGCKLFYSIYMKIETFWKLYEVSEIDTKFTLEQFMACSRKNMDLYKV